MPIIPLEPQIFPPTLLESRGADSADERVWWVLHTRPRQEKSLARDLHASRIPFFLPLRPQQTRIRNRIMTSYLPLFSSYVFLHANHEDRVSALSSSRVVRSIPVADQQQLVRDLAQVYQLLQLGAGVSAEDRMVPGATIAIQSGPLAGLQGKIVEAATRRRFVVEVDFIQRGVSVLLDGDSLIPIVA